MKNYIPGTIFLLVLVVVLAIPLLSGNTVPVLSQDYGNYASYSLYVPGNHSTCRWSYEDSGTPGTFTTERDPQSGKHLLYYDPATWTDMSVQCVSDDGTRYTGRF